MSEYKGAPHQKVVIGINDFTVGGAQKLICDQLRFFDRAKFTFTLITLFQFDKRDSFYRLVPDDVQVIRLHFKSFLDILNWYQLICLLRQLRPDVVLSHLFFSNTVFRVCKLICGYRVLIVEHNTYITKTKAQILVDRVLARLTEKIIAVSNRVANFASIQASIPRTKFVVIHNGLDMEAIRARRAVLDRRGARELLNIPESSCVIINIGRLTDQKNHRLLLQAFSEWVPEHPEYQLIIVGDGTLRPELETMKYLLHLEDRVTFTGEIRDVYPYYASADYFASSSKIEGLSIAFLEGMAFGVPLLATQTAGTDELVVQGKNGYLITAETLAAVLVGFTVMHNANLTELAKGAQDTAEQFSIREKVKEYEHLLIFQP